VAMKACDHSYQGSFNCIFFICRYANWIFDSSKIKMQDVRLVVSYFAKNPLGRMIALHLLMNKWERLNEQWVSIYLYGPTCFSDNCRGHDHMV